jgi:hypothetical protein
MCSANLNHGCKIDPLIAVIRVGMMSISQQKTIMIRIVAVEPWEWALEKSCLTGSRRLVLYCYQVDTGGRAIPEHPFSGL